MDMVKALAGSQAQSLVPPALECSICQELMFHPYALGCGHTFCGSCLKHWFTNRQQSETEKTCPTCRDGVKYPPVLVHAIRELVNNVYDAVGTVDASKAGELYNNAAPDPGPDPFGSLYFLNPIADRDDDVLRCQYCAWEVRDGYCEGCGRAQGGAQFGSESGTDDLSEILSEEDAFSEGENSFINDGEIEYEESDPDAVSNIRRRVVQVSDEDEESSDDFDNETNSTRPTHTPSSASTSRVITIGSSGDEEEEDVEDFDGFDHDGHDEYHSEVSEDYMEDDQHVNSDIGRANMPIVLSDSSDVMSSFEESD